MSIGKTVAIGAAPLEEVVAMPGTRESSILFSLQGLMDREKERIDQEARDRLQTIERENQLRLERERREREEAARREREAHERALRLEAEQRAHEARLEAAKTAGIERVRLEAEAQSRLETAALQQEHERRMAAMELESRVRRLRAFAVGGVILGLATPAVAAGLYFGKLRPEQDHLESAYTRLVSTQRARVDHVQALAEKQQQQNKKLDKALGAAKQELADARREIEHLEQAGRHHRGRVRTAAVRSKPSAPHHVCTGDPDDPLNGCLQP